VWGKLKDEEMRLLVRRVREAHQKYPNKPSLG